jgi:putative membrane protein
VNADLTIAAFWLADSDWGHMDGGWWVVMAIGMVLFWGLLVLGAIWLVRELSGRDSRSGREPEALELLDRRLADGTISPEDYHERRAILTGSSPPRQK